ncbi:MAG TPA: hypothetical protein PLI95_02200 [Polyangiaceae bacterium]|nr:hypothetical protein [Polyangiaceae bacterium]
MRLLSVLAIPCLVAFASPASAQPEVPGLAAPVDSAAVTGREAVQVGDRAPAWSESGEAGAATKRRRDTFLYMVAAGLAAFGTFYTLTRHRRDDEEGEQ